MKNICGIINAVYISVIAFSGAAVCFMLGCFFCAVLGIYDVPFPDFDSAAYLLSLAVFSFSMIISGISSFYKKAFSRISFILGLSGLLCFGL